MKAASKKTFTKTAFIKESSKEVYRGINNAYDLNRTGHYCGNKSEPYSNSSGHRKTKN